MKPKDIKRAIECYEDKQFIIPPHMAVLVSAGKAVLKVLEMEEQVKSEFDNYVAVERMKGYNDCLEEVKEVLGE